MPQSLQAQENYMQMHSDLRSETDPGQPVGPIPTYGRAALGIHLSLATSSKRATGNTSMNPQPGSSRGSFPPAGQPHGHQITVTLHALSNAAPPPFSLRTTLMPRDATERWMLNKQFCKNKALPGKIPTHKPQEISLPQTSSLLNHHYVFYSFV